MSTGSWRRRLGAVEARMPARDEGPIMVRMGSIPGLSFTRRVAPCALMPGGPRSSLARG
jgi:hypothetical protein